MKRKRDPQEAERELARLNRFWEKIGAIVLASGDRELAEDCAWFLKSFKQNYLKPQIRTHEKAEKMRAAKTCPYTRTQWDEAAKLKRGNLTKMAAHMKRSYRTLKKWGQPAN